MENTSIYIKMKNGESFSWTKSWEDYCIVNNLFIVKNDKQEYIGIYSLENILYIEVR